MLSAMALAPVDAFTLPLLLLLLVLLLLPHVLAMPAMLLVHWCDSRFLKTIDNESCT
jgi:hypothetical protein